MGSARDQSHLVVFAGTHRLGTDASRIAARISVGVVAIVATLGGKASAAPGDAVRAEEFAAARKWSDGAFAKPGLLSGAAEPVESLIAVHQSYKILGGRTVWDTPITLGEKRFAHGIYMDAPATLRVRVSQPATEFTAQIGIDNNPNTRSSPQTPSARFYVAVEGKRIYGSQVRRLADGGATVHIPLGNVTEFTLETDDGGDGRSHDQCVWADATVRLRDGSTRFVDTIAWASARRNRSSAPFSFVYGGQPVDAQLPKWEYSERDERVPGGSRQVISYRDPQTGLVVDAIATTYTQSTAADSV